MKTTTPWFTLLLSTAAIPFASADFPGAVISDGPLAYYRFEEGPGSTTLADSSGNGLDIDYSTPTGTTTLGEAAAIGNGALFNADDFMITPLLLDPTVGDFSIEAVLLPDATLGDAVVIANQDGTTGPGRSNFVVNTARVYTTFSGGATTSSGVTASTESFDHVILTYDQSASLAAGTPTFRFFINGEPAGTSEIVPEAANGNWVIGSNKNTTVQFFAGVLDEIAVYDKRLDDPDGDGDEADSRIEAHYVEFLADTETLIDFSSDSTYLDSGQSAQLSWFVSPALTSLTIDDGTGPVDALPDTVGTDGGVTVSPTTTTTYTLTGTGPLGTDSLEVTITVDEPAAINSFTSDVSTLPAGGTANLSWDVTNGTTVTIDNGVGTVDPVSGSVPVVVENDTTFTLSATNSQGTQTAQVTVTILVGADPSLVAHWRVGEADGETNGTTLIAEAGATFSGAFVGNPTFDTADPAPVPGGSTASLSFDGLGSYVRVDGFGGIEGSNPRTLAFWFKGPASQTVANATLVGWGTGGTGNRWDTRINTAGGGNQIRTEVAGSGSNGTVTITDDTWHHCAVVFDPTIGSTIGDVQFYIDGQPDALTFSGGTAVNTTITNPIFIGSSPIFPGRTLTGKMDDIRIYDRALSPDEILALVEPGVSTPLEITAIRRLENGNVEIDWSGPPGFYFFEYSIDLREGNWFELSDNAEILAGETSATITDSFIAPDPKFPKVFYRIRVAD